jgi:hypothetical protein
VAREEDIGVDTGQFDFDPSELAYVDSHHFELESLPDVWQVNLSAAKEFTVPRLGKVTDRVMLLNIFDRTNLIPQPRSPAGVTSFTPSTSGWMCMAKTNL